MSAPTFHRQPKGTPVGGQFAEGRRPGADTTLAEADAAFADGQSELERAHEIGTGAWTGAHTGYVEETIHSYGAGHVLGRMATVFPWDDGNRVVITTRTGPIRQGVLCRDFADFDEAVRFAENNLGWGETKVEEGSRTPWGEAEHVAVLAPGIAAVSTAGHGGIKLSAERNKKIPAALRNGSAWYEEDCEAHIVSMVFPHETRPRISRGYGADRTAEEWEQAARASVRDWYPDGFERATGVKVQPGQSHVRDRQLWDAAHKADWVTAAASSHDVPDGMVKVFARKGDEERQILMPKDEYETSRSSELGSAGRFAVDVSRYEDVTPPPAPKTPTARYTGIRTEGMTAAQRTRVEADLARRYRDDDGTVKTVAQLIEGGEVSGKGVDVENGRREYFLEQKRFEEDSAYSVLPVSKATWDAFSGPDTRTPTQVTYGDLELARHKLDRARVRQTSWGRKSPELVKAEAAFRAAEAAHVAAAAARDAAAS